MIIIYCGVESALAFVTGGMNIRTVDYLNGSTFVIKVSVKTATVDAKSLWNDRFALLTMSLNQPKTATIAYIAIASGMDRAKQPHG